MRGTDPVMLEPGEPGDEPRSDPIRTLVLPLWRSRWLIAVTVALGAGGGLFLGIMQPNTYRSSGKLLYQAGIREQASVEDQAVGGAANERPRGNLINTELHVLNVRSVFEDVARDITPPVLFTPYDPTAMDDETTPPHLRLFHRAQAWWFGGYGQPIQHDTGHSLDSCDSCILEAAEALQRLVEIRSEGWGSEVLFVSYAATDPNLARRVVDATLAAAEKRHREHFGTEDDLQLARGLKEEAYDAWMVAERELDAARDRCEIDDWELQYENLLARRLELEAEISRQQTELERWRKREESLEREIETTDKKITRLVKPPREVNPDYIALKQLHDAQKVALLMLDAETSGFVEDTEARRAALQSILDDLSRQLKNEQPYKEYPPVEQQEDNPRVATLESELQLTRISTDETLAVLNDLEVKLKSLGESVGKAQQCGPEIRDFTRKAQDALNAYQQASTEFNRTFQLNKLDKLGLSNLTTLAEASFPRDKEGPKRAKLLLVGLILGGMAGAALGFIRQLTDKTVRSPYDVERLLGMQVVGILPKRTLPRSIRRAMRRAAL